MDINDLRALATLLTAIAFIGVSLWAYSDKQKTHCDQAKQLPFIDDEKHP